MSTLEGQALWDRYYTRKDAARAAAEGCPRKTCRAKGLLGQYNGPRALSVCDGCRNLQHFRFIENLEVEDVQAG